MLFLELISKYTNGDDFSLLRSSFVQQITVEELETTNEELKSTNEEYMSTNEELQSANEELETSKEELQSLNEELVTVNNELQSKLEELSKTVADHRNFLNNLNVPTIFLDRDLHIKRFTVGVDRLVNLIDTDVGRPIGHISTNIRDENLTVVCGTVLNNEKTVEKEILGTDAHAYLMRAMPYRSIDNRIEGVVVTFVDIQEIRSLQNRLLASESGRKLAVNVIDTIEEPFLVLDSTMKIVMANPSFLQVFQVSEKNIINRNIFEIGQGQWDILSLRQLLGKVLPEQNAFENYHIKHVSPGEGEIDFLLKGRRIVGQGPDDELILLSFSNVQTKL